MEKKITVSVIIPVYNEERYIEGCLNSLIDQSYPRDEMEWVVIDGNSSDRTVEILQKYAERYPIILLNNKKRETPSSLNMGIRHASGRYIIRFDAHAAFPPDYIEKCVKCLETVDADNVGGFIETKAEGFMGAAIAKILSSPFGVGESAFRTGRRSGYVDTVPFGAFRREVFDRIGLFNEDLLRSEDNDINARILKSGGKVYLSEAIHSTYFCRDTVPKFLMQGLQNGNVLFRTIIRNPRAMRLRHMIPFFFLLSVILLPVLGSFFAPLRWLFLAEITAYLLLDLSFSFFRGRAGEGFITFWLYPLFHLTYGLGSLLGLFGLHIK